MDRLTLAVEASLQDSRLGWHLRTGVGGRREWPASRGWAREGAQGGVRACDAKGRARDSGAGARGQQQCGGAAGGS